MGNITDKGSYTITPYNGCDITLISNGAVVAEIGAITWTKENWIKGQLYFSLFNTDVELNHSEIIINLSNERREVLKFVMEDVLIAFNPEKDIVGGVHSFEAKDIKRES